MTSAGIINKRLMIDAFGQWFVWIWVVGNNTIKPVRFKVDTGCNAVVLSHNTLKELGYTIKSLISLPDITGTLASGDRHKFKKLGRVSLYGDNKQNIHICDTDAICHATKETHDLLGTEMFRKFNKVTFHITDDKRMELIR